MFKDDIHFLENKTLVVEVFTKTGLLVGDGELIFSKNSPPYVDFGMRANVGKYSKNTYFQCKAANRTYTLIDCEVVNNSILPKLIVKGDKKNNRFKKISILLQGVSEWMDSDGRFEISNKEIIRKLEQKVFDVDVLCSDGQVFTISSEHWCQTKSHKANNHLLEIYTPITIEIKNGFWSASELIEMTLDIRTVFSLLLGFPIGIEYVLDRTASNNGRSVYFLNATTEKNPVLEAKECFVSSAYLFAQNRWEGVFNNFFGANKAIFKNVTSRVAGMLSYDGFWEYRILAYVSLVDKYVSLNAEANDISLSHRKFKQSKRRIKCLLENLKQEIEINDEEERGKYILIFDSIAKQVNGFKNSRFSSFYEKFKFTMGKMNKDIKEIINLTVDDFQHLKRLRDKIAHGDEPSIKNNGDITHETILSSKLVLLLHYWVYSNLGFTDNNCIIFLNNWLHPTTRQAYLNTQALDKVSGRYFYLKTNKTNFIKAQKQQFSCLVLDYVKRSDSYRINTKATAIVEDWHRSFDKTKKRSVEEELMSSVDTRVKKIAYVGVAYMQHECEVFKVNTGICILNCPDYIATDKRVFDRLRIFDVKSKQWLPSEFEKRVAAKHVDTISSE